MTAIGIPQEELDREQLDESWYSHDELYPNAARGADGAAYEPPEEELR